MRIFRSTRTLTGTIFYISTLLYDLCNRLYVDYTIQLKRGEMSANLNATDKQIAEELKRQITANEAQAKGEQQTGLVRMADIEPQEIDWLWKPYILLGKITLMRGDPGQGKTTVSLTLAAIVSNGWTFPTESGFTVSEPGNVLYITAEDGLADTIAPRLIKAKANMNRVFSYEECR